MRGHKCSALSARALVRSPSTRSRSPPATTDVARAIDQRTLNARLPSPTVTFTPPLVLRIAAAHVSSYRHPRWVFVVHRLCPRWLCLLICRCYQRFHQHCRRPPRSECRRRRAVQPHRRAHRACHFTFVIHAVRSLADLHPHRCPPRRCCTVLPRHHALLMSNDIFIRLHRRHPLHVTVFIVQVRLRTCKPCPMQRRTSGQAHRAPTLVGIRIRPLDPQAQVPLLPRTMLIFILCQNHTFILQPRHLLPYPQHLSAPHLATAPPQFLFLLLFLLLDSPVS